MGLDVFFLLLRGQHESKFFIDNSQSKASATRAINQLMSGLYGADLWIPQAHARKLVDAGYHFLKAYAYLAWLSYEAGEPKFSFKPKLHMLHETVIAMKRALHLPYIYNVISESCSVDEDMVGRLAFLSRHVSPRLQSLRSLERYLTQVRLAWGELN